MWELISGRAKEWKYILNLAKKNILSEDTDVDNCDRQENKLNFENQAEVFDFES